jgi:hypothetical protein
MRDSGHKQRFGLLKRLDGFLEGDLAFALEREAIEERYEAAALDALVDDSVPFHQKTSLRVMEDCADGILGYGRALLEFWRMKAQHEEAVSRQRLRDELRCIPDLSPLGEAAFDRIAQGPSSRSDQPEDEVQTSVDSELAQELLILKGPSFAGRIPHALGYLTAALLEWAGLLEPVLADIAEPPDAESAASILLELEAPTQALLLTKHISLELQNQAQALEKAKRQEADELHESLLKFGGEAQDLLVHTELGRWRLVSRELAERLERAREAHEEQRETRETRARELRKSLNDLDEQVFEVRETIPADVLQVVNEGLSLARTATAEERWFGLVKDYLEEVRYRLVQESWALPKLKEAVRRLRTSMAVSGQREGAQSVEDVLSLLQRRDFEQLGLGGLGLEDSKVRTRVSLLLNWLEVAKLKAFTSDKLRPAERSAIKGLYRFFAQMIVMDRVEEGTDLAFEEPIVYSHWRLRNYKVDALKNNCVFVALPGHPPSGQAFSELDRILDEMEWLDYAYVFLFVPGGTEQQLDRLRSTYWGERLVIIDRTAILDMVLAEAKSSKPLWRLRPLMLRAWGAEKADIFLVNQSICLRTGIFVGRVDLTQRIASSGSDFALYGGRRIGKSSVLKEVERLALRRQETQVVTASLEGDKLLTDDAVARKLARRLRLAASVKDADDFKAALQEHLDSHAALHVLLLLDEIDRYIQKNPQRHIIIEALRAVSEQYGSRFRVVVSGFMELYDCLRGRGPYSPASDPWGRMLDDLGPLPNLRAEDAEDIAKEGFTGILGWDFEIPVIPQRIVRRTGGHPSFVQYFCRKLLERVGRRGDGIVRLSDIDSVFNDNEPTGSFIAHVRDTLALNLDAVGQFLIHWLASEFAEAQGFTRDQMRELADISPVAIPDDLLTRCLERLEVTRVVDRRTSQVYEFGVPDYPSILNRLGDLSDLDGAERKLRVYLAHQQ